MNLKEQVKFIPREKSEFGKVLRERVNHYFKSNGISPKANAAMVLKTIVLLTAYLLPFVLMVTLRPEWWAVLVCWAVMGWAMAGLGMSVMHDANHGAYSDKPWVNQLVGNVLLLLGGSTENWKYQHNILHHTYTNIDGLDDDIQARPGLKFSPHGEAGKTHRFQWFYAFFLYGLLTLYWVVAKDLVQYFLFKKKGLNKNPESVNRLWLLRMTIVKLTYFGLCIGLPIAVGIPLWVTLAGFVLMHFVAGLILTTVFQLAHTLEQTTHPLPDSEGIIHNDWAIHQMETTVNFAPKSPFLTWYLGGLNYQVEHHLFPRISHIHYPAIAPIVEQTAREFGVPYLVNPSFSEALSSHIRFLKEVGRLPNLNDAIG